MKKLFIITLLLFISTLLFAGEITGLFGISFGKTSKEVQAAMKEKGWSIEKSDDDSEKYIKDKGTYGNLEVSDITIYYYKNQFYDFTVGFPFGTSISDIGSTVKSIQETYDLKLIDNNTTTSDGVSLVTYIYGDEKNNTFKLTVLGGSYIQIPVFEVMNYELNKQKTEEEKKKKNQKVSSDL